METFVYVGLNLKIIRDRKGLLTRQFRVICAKYSCSPSIWRTLTMMAIDCFQIIFMWPLTVKERVVSVFTSSGMIASPKRLTGRWKGKSFLRGGDITQWRHVKVKQNAFKSLQIMTLIQNQGNWMSGMEKTKEIF